MAPDESEINLADIFYKESILFLATFLKHVSLRLQLVRSALKENDSKTAERELESLERQLEEVTKEAQTERPV